MVKKRECVCVCGREKIERNKERTIFCPRTTLLADVLLFALCVLTLENLVVDSSAGCGETIKNLTLPFLLFVVVVVMCNIYRIFSLVNLYITISIRLIASRITNNTRNVIPCYV